MNSATTVVTAATATAFAAEHLCHGLDFSHSGRTRGHHFAAEVQVFAGQRMVEVHLDLAVRHLEDEALEAVAVDTIRKNPASRSAVEKLQERASQLRTLGRSAYRNFVNQAVDIDQFAKRQVEGTRASTLVTVLGGANDT